MQRIPLIALATLFLCGCASSQTILSTNTVAKVSGSPKEPMPVTPRVLEQLPKGRYYRIRTVEPELSYVGRVVRADGDSVLLTDVDCERRTSSKVPLLGDIPVPSIKRIFNHTGVGVEILEGDRTLPRAEITGLELLTPAEVDHRLAVKQHAPPPDEPPATERISAQRDKGWHAAG